MRLFANGSYTRLATSNTFTITAPPPTSLSVTPTAVLAGESVTAAWNNNPNPTTWDVLRLYTPNASNSGWYASQTVPAGTNGTFAFPIPSSTPPNTWQLRFFSGGVHLATSNNFIVSVVIGGSVTVGGSPLAGVTMSAPGGGSCTGSNASGQYSCTVPPGWTGTITPSLFSYTFSPASRSYSTLMAHQTAQNYAGIFVTHQVSGTVTANGLPLAGVSFSATNGVTCTSSDASGQYSCNVPNTWSGTVTPSLAGYIFSPASRSYSSVTAAQPAQDYGATVSYQLTGTVTANGSPLAGVSLAADNGGSCSATNASGEYACTVPAGWTGTVTPSLGAYVFTPASRTYGNVTAHQPAQDYAGARFYQLSGTVTANGAPLTGVSFSPTGSAICTPSNASGDYSCTVPEGWSGTVTPSSSGYLFVPASRSFTYVGDHQAGQHFAATLAGSSAPIYYVHADHLNTPRLIANSSGQTVWRHDNTEPFGDSVPDENPSGLGAFEFPLMLSLYYRDKESGNLYAQQRDAYSPGIGRFAQSDPIGLDGGINTYAYVESDPLRLMDPDGLQAQGAAAACGPYAIGCAALITGAMYYWSNVSGTKGKSEAANDACYDDPCERRQKVLLKWYTNLLGSMAANRHVGWGLVLIREAHRYNKAAAVHNRVCPKAQVPYISVSPYLDVIPGGKPPDLSDIYLRGP
ncbi:MAG TPA: RHS repeat-associated core domain-containing protein [Hyphomicrobiaceae bacterium]|nr:RHS repeat-associated core domain-containing protein [Hyphomicrobiaceae bacterium]